MGNIKKLCIESHKEDIEPKDIRFENLGYFFDIKSGIGVELYVEDINTSSVSNGIYSVSQNRWIKEPVVVEDPTDEEPERLSENEAKELLELKDLNRDVQEDSLADLDKTNEIRKDDMHQKVGERTFVDEAVKKAVLIRDNNRCRCV